jgi:hypothetical protein
MTQQQTANLAEELELPVETLEIESLNVVFSDVPQEALWDIAALAYKAEAKVVLGVFPAHIAAELAVQSYNPARDNSLPNFGELLIGIPVAKPVFAEDGTPRGFSHLRYHWLGE